MLPALFKLNEQLVIDRQFDDFLNELYRLLDSNKRFNSGENYFHENFPFSPEEPFPTN
jgi:hypothetical protein